MFLKLLLSFICSQAVQGFATFDNGTSRQRVCDVVNPTQGPIINGEHGDFGSPTPAYRFNYTSGGSGDYRYYNITFDPHGITNPDIIGWAFQVRNNADRSGMPFGSIQKHHEFITGSQLSDCEGDDTRMHTNMVSNKNVGSATPVGFTTVSFIWYEDDGDGPSTIVCPKVTGSFMIRQDETHYEVESDCLAHDNDSTPCSSCENTDQIDSYPE